MPNAPPWPASTLNSLTNSPDLVNSTISLGWVGSPLTASPLAVGRFPFGANTNAKGPRRCRFAKIRVPVVLPSDVVFPACDTAKILCKLRLFQSQCSEMWRHRTSWVSITT